MDISEIKRIVELLQRANCERIALISEVAKEMGVKKTALIGLIGKRAKMTEHMQIFLPPSNICINFSRY